MNGKGIFCVAVSFLLICLLLVGCAANEGEANASSLPVSSTECVPEGLHSESVETEDDVSAPQETDMLDSEFERTSSDNLSVEENVQESTCEANGQPDSTENEETLNEQITETSIKDNIEDTLPEPTQSGETNSATDATEDNMQNQDTSTTDTQPTTEETSETNPAELESPEKMENGIELPDDIWD